MKLLKNRHVFKNNKKLLFISFSYFFSGTNLLMSGTITPEIKTLDIYKYFIFIGIVMIIMVPISFIDNRKEVRGTFAMLATCTIHLVTCLLLFKISSYIWIIILGVEAILEISIFLLLNRIKRNMG